MPESCQSSVRSEAEDYSLYVTNLPFELDEDGIEKIFEEYGSVKAIKANNAGQFAFISYGTYAEAENAIRSLDGKAPLDLKVQFRRKSVDESKKRRYILPDFGSSSDLASRQSSVPVQQQQVLLRSTTSSGYDNISDSPRNETSPPQYYHIGATIQYPMILAQILHYPHSIIEYAATNALWSRGSMTMDAAGRRHVTMGRGYTSYYIPEHRPGIIENIGNIYKKRNQESSKYGSDESEEHFGKCMKCSRHATLCCSMCEGYYCSRACQLADWSKHEEKCAKVPPLVVATSHQPQYIMETDVEPIVEEPKTEMSRPRSEDQEKVELKLQSTLRRFKSARDNEKHDERIDDVKIINNMTQSAAVSPPDQQPDPHVTINPRCIEEGPMAKPDVEITKHEKKKITKGICQLQSIEKVSIPQVPDNFLSSSCYVDVQITSVKEAGKLFFVQKVEDAERIAQLMEKLNENIEQFMLIDKPVIGEIYGVVDDELMFRGLVLSLDPTIVDYIDWGIIGELSMDMKNFREIGNLAEPPRFSQLIKLADKFVNKCKNLDTDSVISVREINAKIENKIQIISVDLWDDSNSVSTPVFVSTSEEKAEKPPSVLNYFTEGMKLIGEVGDIIDKNTSRVVLSFDAILQAFESLLYPFKEDCDAIASNYVNYEPNIHDLVAVKKPDDCFWVRGCVLKYQPPSIIEIASLDEGTIITCVEKIIPLIPKYNEVCIFSAILINDANGQSSSLPSIEIGNIVELEVTAIKTVDCENRVETVEVTMKNGSIITPGLQLHQWTPWESESPNEVTTSLIETPQASQLDHQVDTGKEEDNGNDKRGDTGNIEENSSLNTRKIIGGRELKNNSKVLIQSYRNPSTVFLRSIEPEENERHNRLIQNVAKSALISPPLKSLPQSADYVLAQFIDDNYYRATVICAEPHTQKIKVFYIDYGNVQVTTLDKLKIMPESLMNEPCSAKKVRLCNVKSTPPTEEAHKYLADVVASEKQFIYQFHSSINNEDHVVLKSATTADSCLNDEINHLLTPSWERKGIDNDRPLAKETEYTDKEPNGRTIFDSTNLENFSLDLMKSGKLGGNIGDTVPALFLETIDPGYKYVFAPEDAEMIVHLTSVMPEMMKKYSESTGHYIPRNTELCIALFEDGCWYRGCCLNATASSTCSLIFFLDFGNFAAVRHTNIRKMNEDFLKPKAFGCICNVRGFTDPSKSEVSPQVLARLETLLLQNEIYKVEIVDFAEEEYEIKLPEIRAKLIEEGLLLP